MTLALVEVEGFIVLTSLLITGDFNVDPTNKQTIITTYNHLDEGSSCAHHKC